MFLRKVLGRAVVGTAAAGLLAAPLALTTAPQLMNVACNTDPTETVPTLSLERNVAQYGTKTLATASLSAAEAGKQITFALTGANRSQTIDKRVASNGQAQWLLPRGLVADRTYSITARFDSCVASGIETYRVEKAATKPVPQVVNARRAKFRTTVDGGGGLDPDAGPANFKVRKKGTSTWIRDTTDWLTDGVATANFKDLKRGRYVLKVTYEGNRNFLKGAKKVAFRVR